MTTYFSSSEGFTVAALYRFFLLDDPDLLRISLYKFCLTHKIKGTLILAREGINGTVAGSASAIHELIAFLNGISGFEEAEVKFSEALEMPFYRMKIRIKKEIVTMGVPDLDPCREAGTYVFPSNWNELISDPSTFIVDTRNDYEVSLGTFQNAVNPKTQNFSEFPTWAQSCQGNLEKRKIAMFCTGGIRCEKATAYMKSLGIQNVFHLKGGILQYLQDVPEKESLWKGECFVFDQRVSVGHGLQSGTATLCRACRNPLTAQDRGSSSYVSGVSCPHCLDERSENDRLRYAERQKQVDLAQKRGLSHIGSG